MTLPTYVASGTASSGSSSPRTPAYPAGLAADDRLVLQVFVRASDATCSTPSGWTYEFEDTVPGYGTQWTFAKKATGSESGTVSVAWTGSTPSGFMCIARIYAFRTVTTAARWYETGDRTPTIGGTVADMPPVTTTGTDRLAVCLLAYAHGTQTVASATGETGGSWAEAVAEATSGSALGAGLQLQTANLSTAGILSGGTAALSGAFNGAITRGLALIGVGGTLAVGAPINVTRGEVTATNTVTTTTGAGFMAPAGGIVVAHIVAKHASAAITAFANHPTDTTGGFWNLLVQNVSGTGPALRSAVFWWLVGSTAKKVDSVSFIASSTPESMSATIFTIDAGDGDSLVNFKSALSTTGDPSISLDTAPAADSAVMCFYGGLGTGSAGTVPTGFTTLITNVIATHHRYADFYDAPSPVQSASFSTTNAQSVGILVEVPLVSTAPATVTGTGVATRNSLVGAATGTVPQTAGALDAHLLNLVQACDYRRVVSTYYGPLIRVMRTSDSAQQDIGYNYDNSLDEAALLAFAGSGDAYLVTRYDQSGSLPTAGDHSLFGAGGPPAGPRIVAAGVVEKLNGKPCGKIVTGNSEAEWTTTFTPAYTGTALSTIWAGRLATQTASDRLISLTSGTSTDYNAAGRAGLIAVENVSGPPTLQFYANSAKRIGGVPFTDGVAFAVSWLGDGTNAVLKTGQGSGTVAWTTAWNINRVAAGQVVAANITERLNAGSQQGSLYLWHAAVSTGNLETVRAATELYWNGVSGTGAGIRNALVGDASGTVSPPAGVISDPVLIAGPSTSTAAASHTSASWTPSANALVLILGSARRATTGQPGALGFTSTALSFTKICEDVSASGTFPTARAALYWAQAGPSPVPMTVTVTSTNADRCATNVVEIATNFSTSITNFATGTSITGDPAATMPSPPNALSVVLGFGAVTSAPATITHPFGTELQDISGAQTLARNICFQNGSGPQSAAWSTTGIGSVATLVEIGSSGGAVFGAGEGTVNPLVGAATGLHAIGGPAAATLNRLSGVAAGVHGVVATGAGILNRLAGAAVGTHTPFLGTGAATLNRLSGVAAAVHGVTGTAAGTLNPLAGAAAGTHFPFFGQGVATLNRLAGVAAAAHGVAGTADATLNPLVGAAAGVHGVVATAAATLNRLTGAAVGQHIPFSGTAAATLNRLVGLASGIHAISGIGVGTLNRLVGVATGNHVPFLGTGAGILNPLVGLATGTQAAIGTAAATLNQLSGAAAGAHGVVGTAAAQLNRLVGTAFGTHGAAVVFGIGAGVLNPLVGVAVAAHGVVGTAAGTLIALLGNAAGTHIPAIGTAAATLNRLTGAATGVIGVVGAAAGTLNRLTGAAIATHIPFAGTAAGVLPRYAGAATGVHGVVGTAAGTRNQLVGQALGSHAPAGVTGTAAGTLNRLTGAATGLHGIGGTAAATLNRLVGAATGQHLVSTAVGTGDAVLNPLVGLASGVHGVVGTAAALRNQLLGHAVGITGVAVVGEGAGVLPALVGLAFGFVQQPTFPLTYRDCPVTGFHLDEDNAEFDPSRRTFVNRIALDEQVRPYRRSRLRPTMRRGV